jgi:hypothetical protein
VITEEMLERGLAAAADDYDVPPGAIDRVREQIAPSVPAEQSAHRWRPSRRGWLAIAGAAAAVLIALPFALGGSGTNSDRLSPALAGGNSAGDAAGGVSGSATGTTSGSGTLSRSPLRHQAAVPAPQGATAPKSARSIGSTSSSAGSAGAPVNAPGSFQAFTPSRADRLGDPVSSVPDRVIKTGVLDLQVRKGEVTHTLNAINGIATLLHGYVSTSRTSEGGFAPSGQITLRVPVGAFEKAISRARALDGVKVLSLETSGQDVTNKYVDLAARIKALKSTRETFLTLLSKASTIGETLAVQQHVSDVQMQIEQLQGQLKVLANRSAMSTLTVTVDQKFVAATRTTHHKSGIHRAWDRSVSRFVRGVEAIVGGIGPVLLAALIVGVGWLAARFAYRRLRRRLV